MEEEAGDIQNKAVKELKLTQSQILGMKLGRNNTRLQFDQVNNHLVQLLQKEEKSFEELFQIYNEIQRLKGLNVFIDTYMKGISTESLIKMCSELVYQKYKKGDVILEQGEESNDILYIILSGSVLVIVNSDLDLGENSDEDQVHNKPKYEEYIERKKLENKSFLMEDEKQKRFQLYAQKMEEYEKNKNKKHYNIGLDAFIRLKIALKQIRKKLQYQKDQERLKERRMSKIQSKFISAKEKKLLMKKYGKTTRIMTSGKIFGQKALIQNEKRSATIIIDRDETELLMLHKDTFFEAIERLNEEMYQRQKILFSVFQKMNNFSTNSIQNMMYSFYPELYQKGDILFKENQSSSCLYIVMDGDVSISKTVILKGKVNDEEYEKELSIEICELTKTIQSNQKSIILLFFLMKIYISLVSKGYIIGEETLLNKNIEYTFKINSIKATVLMISKKDMVQKFPIEMRNFLIQQEERKNKLRQEVLEARIQYQTEKYNKQLEKQQEKKALQLVIHNASTDSLENEHNFPQETTIIDFSIDQDIQTGTGKRQSNTTSVQREHVDIFTYDTTLFQSHYLLSTDQFKRSKNRIRGSTTAQNKKIQNCIPDEDLSDKSHISHRDEKLDVSHIENFMLGFEENHQLLDRNLRKNVGHYTSTRKTDGDLVYNYHIMDNHSANYANSRFNGLKTNNINHISKNDHSTIRHASLTNKPIFRDFKRDQQKKYANSNFQTQSMMKSPSQSQSNQKLSRKKTFRKVINCTSQATIPTQQSSVFHGYPNSFQPYLNPSQIEQIKSGPHKTTNNNLQKQNQKQQEASKNTISPFQIISLSQKYKLKNTNYDQLKKEQGKEKQLCSTPNLFKRKVIFNRHQKQFERQFVNYRYAEETIPNPFDNQIMLFQ